MSEPGSLRAFAGQLRDAPTRRAFIAVVLLSLAVAASEGLGFVLLVPLLGQLSEGGRPLFAGFAALTLAQILALVVTLVVLRAVAELLRALAAQRLTVLLVDGLRMRAFAALVGAEWSALAGMNQSANRALMVSTIDRVAQAVDILADGLRVALSLAALGLAALAISPLLALGGALAGMLVTFAHSGLRRRAHRLGLDLTRQYDAIFLRLEQTLDALRLIKSFGREQTTQREMAGDFAAMRDIETRYIRDSGVARAALQIAGAVVLAMLVWAATARGTVPLAMLLPLVALFVRALPLLGALQASAQHWRHAAPAFWAAQSLIAGAEAVAEPLSAGLAPRLREAIRLEQVSYGHASGRAALEGIDARIPAGEITALTGPSGAGKSTLADLVGGLLAPDSGRVLVDGMALEGGLRTAWRSRVAYVQQEPVLFAGSVRDNLLWAAPGADEAALNQALARASADFVHAFPGGIDGNLGAAGRSLSGGERQRIALARALLRNPDLLILDEATSALDDDSEMAIAEAVAALAGDCTVVVIGHRGALTALASHRIMLDSGRKAKPGALHRR